MSRTSETVEADFGACPPREEEFRGEKKSRLQVCLVSDNSAITAAKHDKIIWIFHANPFHDQTKVLEELNILVYDPDPMGKTAAALKAVKVAFAEEKNLAALAERKGARRRRVTASLAPHQPRNPINESS